MNQSIKKLDIQPKDISQRKYFPGTNEHPLTSINNLQFILDKIHAPFYVIVFSGITYLVTWDVYRTGLIGTVILLDYLLLILLPKIRLSFGPPALTLVILAFLRLPFLLFSFPFSLIFQILGTLLVIYAFYIEPLFPKLESYQVSLSGRSHAGSIRIVQLSDLHMSCYSR